MAYGSRRLASASYGGYPSHFKNTVVYVNIDGNVILMFDKTITVDGIVSNPVGTIVAFNGLEINGVDYLTENTNHDNWPTRLVNSYKIARRDGEKLVSAYFGRKEITINGYIQATDQATFEAQVDQLKQIFYQQNGDLLISYNGTIREYFATVLELQIPRDSYNIDWAPFSAKFLVPDGKGYDIGQTVESYSDITVVYPSVYVSSFLNEGTAEAFPVITLTINSEVNLSKIAIAQSNYLDIFGINTPSGQFNNGDVITIDCLNYLVQVNGVSVNFTGVFPTFPTGTSPVYVQCTANLVDISLSIAYKKSYL